MSHTRLLSVVLCRSPSSFCIVRLLDLILVVAEAGEMYDSASHRAMSRLKRLASKSPSQLTLKVCWKKNLSWQV